MHLKVKLIEDDDDGAIFVNANIVGEFGYAQPLETPIASESSTHQFFSPVSGVDYVFLERAAPIISQVCGGKFCVFPLSCVLTTVFTNHPSGAPSGC